MTDAVVEPRSEGQDPLRQAGPDPAAVTDDDGPTEPRAGSLFDHPAPAELDDGYGVPGPPISRQAPFVRGFLGALGVLLALALALAIRQATSVLVLVLIAAFLAVGLNPLVELLIRRGMRRAWAVLIVAIAVLGFVAGIVVLVGGVLRNQITTLINDAPKLLGDLRHNAAIRHLDDRYHFIEDLQKRLDSSTNVQHSLSDFYSIGMSVFTGIADTLIVVVLALYFLGTLPSIKRGLFSLAPASRRIRVERLGEEILRRVGGYVIGAVSVALLAGTVSLVFQFAVGLGQYALPLALFVALLDLVPLVGSLLGASLVSIVGLANSLPIGIACIVFYVIYEALEGYVIYPRVMRSSVDVPEYVTIIAVLLGGTIGGVVGALIALPLAAAVLLVVREVWVRRQDVV